MASDLTALIQLKQSAEVNTQRKLQRTEVVFDCEILDGEESTSISLQRFFFGLGSTRRRTTRKS
jgi:hypothetical protein